MVQIAHYMPEAFNGNITHLMVHITHCDYFEYTWIGNSTRAPVFEKFL